MILRLLNKLFQIFISVKLAVVLLLILGILSAVGTIYEARVNDAEYAQKIIYHSPWMYLCLGLMCIQLICVMVDRWPWKKRHIPFLLAHVGIIITLGGSLVTHYWGIDGSMSFGIGEKAHHVTVNDREILVLGSFNGMSYERMAGQPVDFLLYPPQKFPVSLNVGSDEIKVVDYYHFAEREEEIIASPGEWDGPAVRFQLENSRVNLTRWLFLGRGQEKDEMNLGPARVILTENENFKASDLGNQILFQFHSHADPHSQNRPPTYEIHSQKKEKTTLKGELKEGMTIETGWMGLKLRILRLLPHAQKKINYVQRDEHTARTGSAVKISFQGQEYWAGEDVPLRLFTETHVLVFMYQHRRLNLGFDLILNQFRIGRYQGTRQAMSYESDVTVNEKEKTTISMNEPLKYNGYTFYQSSFQENEAGEPIISVLSVNHDPGRPWKYLGSFLVILGALLMFYQRRLPRLNLGVPSNQTTQMNEKKKSEKKGS